jgi:ribosomal-protein-alanine N-acetyltransferase
MMSSVTALASGSAFSIEPATWRDLNPLREMEKVCFPLDAWPLWDMIGVLTLPNIIRLKAVVDGRAAGFIAGDLRPSQRLAWIATLSVLPHYRRQGIGTALLQECEKRLTMPRVRLCVRASNQEAIHLYDRNGYQRVAVWPDYYRNREDAVVMEKVL